MKNNVSTYIKATFAVVVWGASFVATKIALQEISPVMVVWLRFSMGVIVLGFAVSVRKQFALPSRKEIPYFTLLGFIGITFHQWLQSTGLVTAHATTTGWLMATTPVFMALLGWLILKERLGAMKIAGILMAAIGVLLVVSRGDLSSISTGHLGEPGDFLILVSAPNWAIFSVLSRQGLQRHPAARMMFYVMFLGWLLTTVLFLRPAQLAQISQLTRSGWLGIGFLGILCSGVAYIFWYDALQAISAAQVGAFLYIEPFITVIVAWVILAEPLLPASIAGGLVIIAGVYAVNQPDRLVRLVRLIQKRLSVSES